MQTMQSVSERRTMLKQDLAMLKERHLVILGTQLACWARAEDFERGSRAWRATHEEINAYAAAAAEIHEQILTLRRELFSLPEQHDHTQQGTMVVMRVPADATPLRRLFHMIAADPRPADLMFELEPGVTDAVMVKARSGNDRWSPPDPACVIPLQVEPLYELPA